MMDTPIAPHQFPAILNALVPEPVKPDSQTGVTRRQNKRDGIAAAYRLPANAGIHGTAWGAYNAFTEYTDWASSSDPNVLARRAATSGDQKAAAHQTVMRTLATV